MQQESLSYGMVGGGQGAFIGEVHRKAAAFDGLCRLEAGCFSRDQANTLQTGRQLGVVEGRLYEDFNQMARAESRRKDGIDFAVIVTPNDAHYPAARAFLQNRIHVVCDKPLTVELAQAEELAELARRNDLLFCVTYTYVGYPMVKHIRQIVREGRLGELRLVVAEYPQAWLAAPVEKSGLKVAWRTDPARSGRSCSVADIGTHIENMVSYLTGLEIESLSARLDVIGEGRTLDTNGFILVRYAGGAVGSYWCSQVAIGAENALRVRIIGSKGSVDWAQEQPDQARLTLLDQPTQVLSKGNAYLSAASLAAHRTPPGHPDGIQVAFANLYRSFARALLKKKAGLPLGEADLDFPGVEAGVQGVRFVERCVDSSAAGSAWVEF